MEAAISDSDGARRSACEDAVEAGAGFFEVIAPLAMELALEVAAAMGGGFGICR